MKVIGTKIVNGVEVKIYEPGYAHGYGESGYFDDLIPYTTIGFKNETCPTPAKQLVKY